MDAESIRSEVAFRLLPLERAGRPARAEELDPRRGAVRRRGVDGADRRRAAARARASSARSSARSRRTSARSCATASSRPTGSSSSCARRRASAAAAADEADARRPQRAAARRKKRRGADEAPATSSRGGLRRQSRRASATASSRECTPRTRKMPRTSWRTVSVVHVQLLRDLPRRVPLLEQPEHLHLAGGELRVRRRGLLVERLREEAEDPDDAPAVRERHRAELERHAAAVGGDEGARRVRVLLRPEHLPREELTCPLGGPRGRRPT